MSKLQLSSSVTTKLTLTTNLTVKLLHLAIGGILTLTQGCQVCNNKEESIVKHMVEVTSKIKVEYEFRRNSMELGLNYKKEF